MKKIGKKVETCKEIYFMISMICFVFLGIENDYKGPQLEDGKVTLEFMESLMELYKNEGKLHRKYAYKVP